MRGYKMFNSANYCISPVLSFTCKSRNFHMKEKVPALIRFTSSSAISIPVPWGTIEGKTWGNSTNPPVLVVHGRMDNCDSFKPLISLLPQEYFYVCIDLPGNGKSPPLPLGAPLNFFDYVLTLKRVVDYFTWKEVTCLNHSFGGMISLYLAAIYPELVKKIITVENGGAGSTETQEITHMYREHFDQFLSLEKKQANRSPPSYTYTEAMHRMKNNRWHSQLTDEACNILIGRSLVPNDGGYYFVTDQRFRIEVLPVLTVDQQISIMKQICCPILMIMADECVRRHWAKRDKAKPLYNYFKTEAPNVSVVIVKGNHDVHLIHPERVSPHVRSFLCDDRSQS